MHDVCLRSYENKPAEVIQKDLGTDYLSRINAVLTTVRGINKTDVKTLGDRCCMLPALLRPALDCIEHGMHADWSRAGLARWQAFSRLLQQRSRRARALDPPKHADCTTPSTCLFAAPCQPQLLHELQSRHKMHPQSATTSPLMMKLMTSLMIVTSMPCNQSMPSPHRAPAW